MNEDMAVSLVRIQVDKRLAAWIAALGNDVPVVLFADKPACKRTHMQEMSSNPVRRRNTVLRRQSVKLLEVSRLDKRCKSETSDSSAELLRSGQSMSRIS